MSKQSHTPGPWRASQTYPLGDWVVHAARIPQQLAYLAASPHVDWPLEANARLIAAAPELLEFAKWVADRGGDNNCMDIFKRARSLIAKAEGGAA